MVRLPETPPVKVWVEVMRGLRDRITGQEQPVFHHARTGFGRQRMQV